jgi:CDP-glycerol glycerophosphotransferase
MRIFTPGRKTWYPKQWLYGLLSCIYPIFRRVTAKQVVVFGAFHGDAYRGNTRILFEYFIEKGTHNPIWLSRNPDVVRSIQQLFGVDFAALLHTHKGLQSMRDATLVLYTHGTSDFPFVRIPGQARQFHTYHGLPTKRGEYMKPNGSETPPSIFHRWILKYRFGRITYFLSTSPFVSSIFAKRFNLRADQFIQTGFPSLDALTQASKPVNKSYPDTRFILLYAPTYRRRATTRWFPFNDMNWPDFATFLDDMKITLVLRPHPNEPLNSKTFEAHSTRIVTESSLPVNDILLQTDAVVTDYSGIYLEALLLDIPPIFIPYDIDRYERGLPYNYEHVTPGPKVLAYNDFKRAIVDALVNTAPEYRNHRDEIKSLFFEHPDSSATYRTVACIEQILLGE